MVGQKTENEKTKNETKNPQYLLYYLAKGETSVTYKAVASLVGLGCEKISLHWFSYFQPLLRFLTTL